MLKVNVYSAKGTKLSSVGLPKELEGKENLNLLAQAIRVYEARGHIGLAKTKTRAEVLRTKKKLYKQKGTGGARHGSRRAPIFVGGGVAHGPRPIERKLSLPEKTKNKALAVAVSLKVKKGELFVVDGISSFKKTKEVKNLLGKISKTQKRFTFVLSDANWGIQKTIKNIKGVEIVSFKSLNAYHVFFGGIVLFDKEIISPKKIKKETKK